MDSVRYHHSLPILLPDSRVNSQEESVSSQEEESFAYQFDNIPPHRSMFLLATGRFEKQVAEISSQGGMEINPLLFVG